MWSRFSFIICLFFLTSTPASAAVTLSEIAWMGNETSANDEWIELYNNGSAVDVTGWELTDSMNLAIPLTGTIPASSYSVLERTDDSSAPGAAFLVYTGALTNAGATLTLRRADGTIADQVAGGDGWENIGGDNTTKETAQLLASGWVTAPATPGETNVAPEPEADSSDESDDVSEAAGDKDDSVDGDSKERSSSSNGAHPQTHTLYLIPRELAVTVTAPSQVYVNQPVHFSAAGSGVSDTIVNSLSYQWNFGDLHTSTQSSPTHHFAYPGQYAVTLYARYKDYDAEYQHEITVLPRQLSVNKLPSGDVQLFNDARTSIDVSGYQVAGLTLPPRTTILPRGTVTIPAEQVTKDVVVHDQRGVEVARYSNILEVQDDARVVEAQSVTSPPPVAIAPVTVSEPPTGFSFSEAGAPTSVPTISAVAASTTTAPTMQPLVAAVAAAGESTPATPSFPVQNGWLYIFIALLFGLVLGIYTRYL